MAIFYLNTLLDWARRTANDRLLRNRDVLVSDGTGQVVLTNDGNVQLTSVSVGGTPASPADYSQDVNVLTFNTPPTAGVSIIVVYNRSQYLDTEVNEYLVDAVNSVMADIGLSQWQTNDADPTNPLLNYPDPIATPTPTQSNYLDPTITKLLILKAALTLKQDKGDQNSDDAILIKDGDTTIDTSKTAAASERSIMRLQNEYDKFWRIAVANRQTGIAIQNNFIPLPYPWSTPNMMPGEVNGPTY
jgi:hypothetical protein